MPFKFDGFDTLLSIGKTNADALAKSSAATVKAIEDITKTQQAAVARSVDKADAAVKAIFAVKSPTEWAELNNRLARETIEDAIADSRKLAEITTSALTAAIEPISRTFAAGKAA